jgi:hypothetical protein
MTKRGGKDMMNTANKELQEEMVGVLTAISIVSKRLANRLIELEEDETQDATEKREEKTNE